MITIKESAAYEEFARLWNSDLGFIFPLTEKKLAENVLAYPEKFCYAAFVEEEMVGFIIGKTASIPEIPDYDEYGWVHLIYVTPRYRRQGVGTALFERLVKDFRDKPKLRVGADIGCFFPGVPNDFDGVADAFFAKQGFKETYYTHDLINLAPQKQTLKPCKYFIGEANKSDLASLYEFVSAEFPGRWQYEIKTYLAAGGQGKGLIVAKDGDKVVGYVIYNDQEPVQPAYNIMWQDRFPALGGLGPLGVAKAYRRQNIGLNLLRYAHNKLIDLGCRQIMIDWTGLMEAYRKLGFEVFKAYKIMVKVR